MPASRMLVRAERVAARERLISRGGVLVSDTAIEAVDEARFLEPPAGVEVLEGSYLLPGFIDLHVHGFGGNGFGGGPDEAREASRLVARSGVTTWYAGLGAGPSFESIAASVGGAGHVVGKPTGGARLAGIFLEGPYISREKRGAWNPDHLRAPSVPELRSLIDASTGTVRRINVAPELPGAIDLIRAAREAGLVVSVGHSNATYEETMAAVAAGATVANHTYNAMSGLGHRSPGMVGAVLTCDGLLAELILDGVHVHPAAADALYHARGPTGVALITDGSYLTGMPDGVYERGGRTVTVAEGSCRLPDGTLAGSVSTFERDLRNARRWLTDDLAALALISSGNAARAMALDRLGFIEPGHEADLVLLDDDFQVVATIVAGEAVYRRGME
jgi:N-acetylglucosamine-6-phosphate deacetylase